MLMKNLFFIALVPPFEIREEVSQLKEIAADKFNSAHALKSPPHITLYPPFKLASEQTNLLLNNLRIFSQSRSSFHLFLNNFNTFAPKVIYIDVERNESLIELQQKLLALMSEKLDLRQSDRHGFNPHMTIAFRDLKPAVFSEAWSFFSKKKFERFFPVDTIYLLKHNGKVWEVFESFPLK